MADGDGSTGKFFRCPYHAWTFKLDGTHLSAPLRTACRTPASTRSIRISRCAASPASTSYRGFVFASQAADGPDLKTFLNGVASSIDNLCDRSPVGEVEVTAACFACCQRSNWKVFYENLHDTMHAPVTHESSVVSARAQADELGRDAVRAADHGRQRRTLRILGKAGAARLRISAMATWKASSTRRRPSAIPSRTRISRPWPRCMAKRAPGGSSA
ncbi:SRPBCC family protein [Burkholderia gladioli]|uniref:SRPBCC family protein n=1 Tax=Burkholderia gladioli TaxID=28095 RepID=UPI003D20FDEC